MNEAILVLNSLSRKLQTRVTLATSPAEHWWKSNENRRKRKTNELPPPPPDAWSREPLDIHPVDDSSGDDEVPTASTSPRKDSNSFVSPHPTIRVFPLLLPLSPSLFLALHCFLVRTRVHSRLRQWPYAELHTRRRRRRSLLRQSTSRASGLFFGTWLSWGWGGEGGLVIHK